jgi:ATP-dependent Clp protease ATP-binding subunit ClpB
MGITMNPEKLTSKFKSALNDAQSIALAKDHQFIEGIHLLSAMLEQQGGRKAIKE